MPVHETLPLQPEDKLKLRRQLYAMLMFPIVVIGIFWVFLSFMFNSGFADDSFGIYMMMAFSVLFFGVIVYMISSTAIDLKRGSKTRVTGKITDKRMHWSTTGDRPGYGHKKRSHTRRSYYLYIDGNEFSVEYPYYSQARIGTTVQLDRAPKSGTTLGLEVVGQLDDGDSEPSENDGESHLEKHVPHARYTQRDHEALKRMWKTGIKARFVRSSPFIVISFVLILSGFWSFVVVLFPLWVVPLYQGIKWYRSYRNFIKNKDGSYKRGVATIVEDKYARTSNRYSSSNRVVLTAGPLVVDTALYDKLSVGDKVILYKTQYGNQPLSLVLTNGEEVHLV